VGKFLKRFSYLDLRGRGKGWIKNISGAITGDGGMDRQGKRRDR